MSKVTDEHRKLAQEIMDMVTDVQIAKLLADFARKEREEAYEEGFADGTRARKHGS